MRTCAQRSKGAAAAAAARAPTAAAAAAARAQTAAAAAAAPHKQHQQQQRHPIERATQLDPDAKARHTRPPGWVPPGPPPVGAAPEAPSRLAPSPDETLSYLTGDWRLFQLKRGHRWSIDDMMVALVALQEVQRAMAHSHPAAAAGTSASSASALHPGGEGSGQQPPQLSSQQPPALGLGSITHALDIGCGIGSVLLMVAWGLRRLAMEAQLWQPQAPFSVQCLGVEAQQVSFELARRSIEYNLGSHAAGVQVINQDLRQPLPAGVAQAFQLVTGTPPYIPPGAGGQSERPQKAPCCVELRGGMEDYCQAAAAALAPGGVFVVCGGLQGQPFKGQRAQQAAAAAHLVITRQVTVVTRDGKPPLFAVYVMRRAADIDLQRVHAQQQQLQGPEGLRQGALPPPVEAQVAAGQLWGSCEEGFVVRARDGSNTPAWHAAREAMGLPPLPA